MPRKAQFKLIKARMFLVRTINQCETCPPGCKNKRLLTLAKKVNQKVSLKQTPRLTWMLNSTSRTEKEIRISHLRQWHKISNAIMLHHSMKPINQ